MGKIKKIVINSIKKSMHNKTIKGRRNYWLKEFKKNTDSKKKLSSSQINEIKKFYEPYIKVNPIYHEFYYQKTGKYNVNYIPDDIYYAYIDAHFNNWKEALSFDNKVNYDKIFYSVKQPKTIVKRVNNIWIDESNNIISYKEVLERVKKYKECFLKKATESEGGHGVYCIKDINDFCDKLSKIQGDLIVQKPLKQSKVLNKLNSSSINTIRVLSLTSEKGVKIYSTIIRMGINGARVDNASSGGITCGIKDDGRLKDVAYSSKGEKYECHPTSKVKFSDIKIPNYKSILELVKKLAPTITHFRLVSWDIALDEKDEPVLIEANLRYGELDFHQLNNGPIFGNDTKKILNEVFKK